MLVHIDPGSHNRVVQELLQVAMDAMLAVLIEAIDTDNDR